ncbi:hypothetical protein EIP91_009876 [Steccherinum ochraceum]|uniref:Uncharacterized protein n=1 Tax=Steccherinum ochraceum TaxID=92696 RepID=A0A4R0R958_9APHY|nr:hypothetical protein EIP91_009876 [Steccherinum ochraceum]
MSQPLSAVQKFLNSPLTSSLASIPDIPTDVHGNDCIPNLHPFSPYSQASLSRFPQTLQLNKQFNRNLLPAGPDFATISFQDTLRGPNLPFAMPGQGQRDGFVFYSRTTTCLDMGRGREVNGQTMLVHIPDDPNDLEKLPFEATPLLKHFMTDPAMDPVLSMDRVTRAAARGIHDLGGSEADFWRFLRHVLDGPVRKLPRPRDELANVPDEPARLPLIDPRLLAAIPPTVSVNTASVTPSAQPEASKQGLSKADLDYILRHVSPSDIGTPEPGDSPSMPIDVDAAEGSDSESFSSEDHPIPARLSSHYNLRPTAARLGKALTDVPPAEVTYNTVTHQGVAINKKKLTAGIHKSRRYRPVDLRVTPRAGPHHALALSDRHALDQILDLPVGQWSQAEADSVKAASNALVRASFTGQGFAKFRDIEIVPIEITD